MAFQAVVFRAKRQSGTCPHNSHFMRSGGWMSVAVPRLNRRPERPSYRRNMQLRGGVTDFAAPDCSVPTAVSAVESISLRHATVEWSCWASWTSCDSVSLDVEQSKETFGSNSSTTKMTSSGSANRASGNLARYSARPGDSPARFRRTTSMSIKSQRASTSSASCGQRRTNSSTKTRSPCSHRSHSSRLKRSTTF